MESLGHESTNGNGTTGNDATGKRKRDDIDDDVEMTNGHVSKKVAGDTSTNGGGSKDKLIALDEGEGTILIDD